jgi:hypothetical protein
MELRRVAGIDAASQALGHANLNTTLSIYGHMDASDLEAAMGKYSDWLVTQDESIVPTEDSVILGSPEPKSGDGGNRTHVRDRVRMASTSVAGALISSLARLAGGVAGDQPP